MFFDANKINDLLNALFIRIDAVIYKFVSWIYQIFLLIADAHIFKTDTYELIVRRIYVVLGIAMLFFLAYTILKSITDPDSVNEGNGGVGKIITNTVISLVAIAVIPTIFNFLYGAQEILLKNNFIGKVIMGNYSTTVRRLDVTFNSEMCPVIKETRGADVKDNPDGTCVAAYTDNDKDNEEYSRIDLAGNSIAVDFLSAFYYPEIIKNSDEDSNNNNNNPTESEATSIELDQSISTENEYDNQAYNVSFNYEQLNEDDRLNAKEKELYKTIAAFNSCHNNSDNYAYGTIAQKCADEVDGFNNAQKREAEELYLNYKSVLQYAKTTGDMDGFKLLSNRVYEGEMQYSIIISTIAGIFIGYIFLNYCLDMGLRAAKLGFAQIIAPVPLMARIIPQQSGVFTKWRDFTITTYFEVFLRVAVVYLGMFLITNLPPVQDMFDYINFSNISIMSIKPLMLLDVNSASWGVVNLARIGVIIGILMFIKQAPDLISESLGIKLNAGSLGIRNKLNNMFGGKTLLNAGSRVGGTVSGAIGAGYMAKRHGGEFWSAAVKGGREGYKNKGWQFGKQAQRAYHETTGSNYKGSYLFGGDSLTGKANRALDNNEKTLKDADKKRLEAIQAKYETSPEFNNMVNSRMSQAYQDAAAKRNAAIAQANQDYRNAYTQAQNAHSAAEQAVTDAQNKVNEAQNYKQNESEKIQRRKEAFERSAEYQNYIQWRTDAQNRAITDSVSTGRDSEELKKEYMEQYLANASEDAKKYYEDSKRNLDQEEAQKKQEAQEELNRAQQEKQNADQVFEDAKKTARSTLDNAKINADNEYNSTIAKKKAEVTDAVRKEIIKNPQNKAQQEYSDAANIVGAQSDKDKIWDILNHMNNNNNSNSN